MFNKVTSDVRTTELYIPTVMDRTICKTHQADIGESCYYIQGDRVVDDVVGVCNKRAKQAGFSHPVSQNSLRLNRQKKR